MKAKNLQTIYLDNAAATPLDKKVYSAMRPFLELQFGNPSALYKQGREAKKAVAASRKAIANEIKAKSEEIIFTAGGTESDNLAIFGVARNMAEHLGRKQPHIITSSIEHSAVLEPCRQLEKEGFTVTYLKVDREGFVNIQDIKKAVRPETVLISVMYANNEIGSIQSIAGIGKWLKADNEARAAKKLGKIYFHTDACQAAGFLDLNVQKLGVDLLTANGSKIYGPKQIGFLFVRNGVNLKPIIYGGGQEKGLRSGTENVANVIGLAKALELAQTNRETESRRVSVLRDYFINQVIKFVPKALLNGSAAGSVNRLANNANFTFEGVEGEALQIYLDSKGISVGTGSACDSESEDPSHVLIAIGRSSNQAKSSIRFSLGKFTTKKNLDYAVKTLAGIIKQLRSINK